MSRRFPRGVLFLALFLCLAAVGVAPAREARKGRTKHAVAKVSQAQNPAEATPPEKDPPGAAAPTMAGAAPVPAPAPASALAPHPLPAPSAPECDEACQQGRRTLDLQGKLEWLCAGLILVGFLQGLTMIWHGVLLRRTGANVHKQADWMEALAGTIKEQVGILRGSVAAAQTSADAAVRQISHAVQAERPWMDVQMSQKDLNSSHLKFVAKNRGSSPAKVTMYTVEKVVVSTEDVAKGPRYGKNGGFAEAQWRLAGDEFVVGEFQLPPNLLKEVKQPGVSVLYQGFIRYNDTLTEDLHETRFCFEAFLQDDGPVRFRMSSAKGYNTMS